MLRNKRGCNSERPAHRDEEWPPLATTRESPNLSGTGDQFGGRQCFHGRGRDGSGSNASEGEWQTKLRLPATHLLLCGPLRLGDPRSRLPASKSRAHTALETAVKTAHHCSALIGPVGNHFQTLLFLKFYVCFCPNWAIRNYSEKHMVNTHPPCLVFYQLQSDFHWENPITKTYIKHLYMTARSSVPQWRQENRRRLPSLTISALSPESSPYKNASPQNKTGAPECYQF